MPTAELPARIAILVPMPSELRPLLKVLPMRKTDLAGIPAHTVTIDGRKVIAVRTGIGMAGATRVTEHVLRTTAIDHVVVTGVAGGLAPGLAVRSLIVPEVVLDGHTGARYSPTPIGNVVASGTLQTSDELMIDLAALRAIGDRGITAIDMETAAVAAVCERHGCPWSVFRGISDNARSGAVNDAVLALAHPDGSSNLKAVARYLLRRPWRIRQLMALERDTRAAATVAAIAAVEACGFTVAPPGQQVSR